MNHQGHSVGTRFSGPWCNTCNTPVERAPDCCINCGGKGWKLRMRSAYSGTPGKKYNCGNCKGTGKQKPAVCVDCGQPATIYTSHCQDSPHAAAVHHCAKCYEIGKVGKWLPQ